ncbi:ribonuclease HI [Polluticoccus soli]|uniref:ribonuclease HI n=1 Tax=Polluticoccus soli TaxID=3034150 RepID=UPI003B83152D
MSTQLIIYTDGAARGNPGPGGYGVVLNWAGKIKELSQGFRLTTNNRMELMAVVEGLKALSRDGLDIVIYSDSSYVVNSVEKGWVFDWVKKGFKDKKNPDLWKEFLLYYKRHRIKFVWVKGHADNPWNNRCDQLATAAADSRHWLVDEGYEREKNGGML